ncbi:hypothetical protein FS837_009685 [Tulasnella sp. UAMH 9824]|nr:hypothetical protein FS837_009685 [Tulasnella sp. UAMH 9824]
MHQTWTIPEVATAILRRLEWADLARMARVCHGLSEMAIPLIWDELYDISVFTALLGITEDGFEGPDIFMDNSSVPQCEEPVYGRLAHHTRFIRKVDFALNSNACRILKFLSNTPSFNESLVKLKSLDIVLDLPKETIDGAVLFRTFYTPIMTRIGIAVNFQTPAEHLRSFLQAITTSHLPSLQSLYIESTGRNSIDPFYLEDVLRAHQQLQEVDITTADCTQEMLEVLDDLPLLRDLSLRFWNHSVEESLPILSMMGKGFPHLVRLDICCALKIINQVLGSIESGQMEAFKMSVPWPGLNSDPRMGRMLERLWQFPELKEVELRLGITVVWEDIKPVLACRGLTRFSLIAGQVEWIPIDGTHLDAMAQAWPHLSELTLTHTTYHNMTGTPLIKLADLVHLTDTRPSLRSLCISFDARRNGQEEVFALVTAPTETIPRSWCQLELLDVGVSLKDSAPDAGTQLGKLFTSWWPTLRELKQERRSRQNWNRVMESVRIAAEVPSMG